MLGLSAKYKKSVPQIALRWLIQHGFIVLPKSKDEGRIKENIDLFDFELTEEEMEKINKLREINHRCCWNPHRIIY